MKRKASVLEDTRFVPQWPQYDSSSVSTPSPESIKAPHNSWNTPAIPYLSSRTRKRYRDNRPSAESVHQNTLAKLYNAQQQIHTQEIAQQRGASQVDSYLMSLDTPGDNILLEADVEPKQRSLDSFFGGSAGTIRQTKPQPRIFAPNTVAVPHHLICEDCGASAQPDADIDAMDVDMATQDQCCNQCRRVVCDMCAIRGNQRICLECAVPGGGT